MTLNLDPAYLKRNVRSLSKIGGVYDYIAAVMHSQHKELLMIQRDPGTLPFKLLNDAAMLPSKGYPDDTGFDLFVSQSIVLAPGRAFDIPTGIATEFPEGTWGMIVGRSSTLRKRNILVNTGIIDTGWRGELFINALNNGNHPIQVEQGERLGQLILMNNVSLGLTPIIVDELNYHPRGEKGFGSTGL